MLRGDGQKLAGFQSRNGGQLDLQQSGAARPVPPGDPAVALPAVLQARHPPDAALPQLPAPHAAPPERHDLRSGEPGRGHPRDGPRHPAGGSDPAGGRFRRLGWQLRKKANKQTKSSLSFCCETEAHEVIYKLIVSKQRGKST